MYLEDSMYVEFSAEYFDKSSIYCSLYIKICDFAEYSDTDKWISSYELCWRRKKFASLVQIIFEMFNDIKSTLVLSMANRAAKVFKSYEGLCNYKALL